MLASLLLAAVLSPQSPRGEEGPPLGLTIVVVDVGQGDGLVLRTPDGTVHVVDGGPDGQGNAALEPVIAALAPSAFGATFLTHWHPDHSGGLDEVLAAHPFTACYDRGDVARPGYPENAPYLTAAGARRRALVTGQVVALGGGVTLKVIAQNGQVLGGAVVAVAGQNQEENARSLVLRLDYGSFSMWLGGDVTGGGTSGGSATPDVESPASLACGDVDVYHVDHHGSVTSTNANLVARLSPELAVVSCGAKNPYGHPSTTAINRINAASAARVLWSTTAGTGMVGFGASGQITISTDGRRYRVAAQRGQFLDFWCDELRAQPPAPGELVISEVQRQPLGANEALGEYVELTNVGPGPVGLKGLQIAANGGSFTIVTNLVAYPGRPLVLQAHGDPATNGGVPVGFPWPYQALPLGNASDTLRVRAGAATLEQVAYGAGFPGGAGVAAERTDLLAPASATVFAAATQAYGAGGKGSPGVRNPGDASPYGARVAVAPALGELVLHASDLAHGGGLSIVGLAFADAPPLAFLGAAIPLSADPLLLMALGLPGCAQALPGEGYRSWRVPLPLPDPLVGLRGYAAHVVLDPLAKRVLAVSPAAAFLFP